VQCSDFSPHATGFSQWLMTEIDEHRMHSAKNRVARVPPCRNFTVGQEPDPPNYCLLLATRCRFGSAGASPSHFLPTD
jgi:hypothetical protein